MAQVDKLEIEHSFQEDVVNQAAGRAPIDAKKLDQTLASVAENQNLINENLKMLQRDDGQLKDAIVGPAQMQRALLNLVKEYNHRGAYIAATYYAKNDGVDYNGSLWICAKPHNSTSAFVETNWLRYGASGAEDVTVAAQQAQQAATAAAASLRNTNTAASVVETLKTQTEAAATNASNAASSAAMQAQQIAQNTGVATAAKQRAEAAAMKAEAAANSGAITTPKPIASANLAILTGVYYTTGNVPTAAQHKVDVIATDTQIIQTATKGDGNIFTRSFSIGSIEFPNWNPVDAKIPSVSALRNFSAGADKKVIELVSYHADGKGDGGGLFYIDELDTTTADNGGTVIIGLDGKRYKRSINGAFVNVKWFGARGDGVTDDTAAIKRCIASLGTVESWNGASNPNDAAFCTVYFPASKGNYIVSDTIFILPYMTLRGDSSYGGSLWNNSQNWKSVIEAKFPSDENYKWVISTLNRVRATGELTAWDSNYSGNNYDNGVVTGCFGSAVKNLVIVNFDTTKRVYGGIRMQNAPQCRVQGVYVQGFDVGVYSSGSWDSKFDFGSVTYKCGFLAYGDMNNAMIDGYHHGTKDGLAPMLRQHPQALLADSTAGFIHNQATAKYGVRINYAYGFAMRNIIAEYHDVGIAISQSTGNIVSAYVEKNTRAFAIVASNITIGSIAGVKNDYSFAFGTGSQITVNNIVPDSALLGFADASSMRYNCLVNISKRVNVQQRQGCPFVYRENPNILYVDATNGVDTNSGLSAGLAVKTLSKALEIVSFNEMQAGDLQSNLPRHEKFTIYLIQAVEHTLSAYVDLHSKDVVIRSLAKGTFTCGSFVLRLHNSKLTFIATNFKRTDSNNFLASDGGIICNGKCSVSFVDSNITTLGAQSIVSVHPTVYADVDLSIMGGLNYMISTSKFYKTTSVKAIASVIVKQDMTNTTVRTTADKGVSATVDGLKSAAMVINA